MHTHPLVRFETVFGPYGQVLRIPGALAFSGASLIGRLPISMISLSIVLLETSRGVSYAIAGVISAAFAIASAVGGPFVSGYVDRHGQHKVMPLAASAYTVFMVGLLVALDQQASLALVLPLAAGAGMLMPNVGSLVRARWAYVCRDRGGLHVAYAWESILDEVIFVVGPPLATMLALQISPEAGLVACIILVAVGTALLVPQRRTEPAPHGKANREGGIALRNPGMVVLTCVFILIGGIFGSFEVVTVAFAAEQSATSATGVLLAIYAVGSLLAGLFYGSRPSPKLYSRQLVWILALMAVINIGFPLSSNVYTLAVVCFVSGFAVSPSLIAGNALVERIVPSAQLTEGITWTITGLAVGLAISAPAAGLLIDSRGAQFAYLITAGCGLTAFVVGLLGRRRLEAAEHDALEIIAAKAIQP